MPALDLTDIWGSWSMNNDWNDNHVPTSRHLTNSGGIFVPFPTAKLGDACGQFLTLDRASISQNLGAGVTAFTLAAWGKLNAIAANKGLIGWTGTGDLPSIYTDATGIVARVGSTSEWGRVDFAGLLDWFHVGLSFYGAGATNADRLKLTINGVEQSLTYNATIPSSITGTGTFRIGGPAGNKWWNGLADEALVFSRALSVSEINTFLYNKNIGLEYPYEIAAVGTRSRQARPLGLKQGHSLKGSRAARTFSTKGGFN